MVKWYLTVLRRLRADVALLGEAAAVRSAEPQGQRCPLNIHLLPCQRGREEGGTRPQPAWDLGVPGSRLLPAPFKCFSD